MDERKEIERPARDDPEYEPRAYEGSIFRRSVTFWWIAILFGVGGCTHTAPKIARKGETRLAVEQIKGEWLKKCEYNLGPPPTNNTGNLLADYTALAVPSALCRERHNSLVEYLAPVVAKERASAP